MLLFTLIKINFVLHTLKIFEINSILDLVFNICKFKMKGVWQCKLKFCIPKHKIWKVLSYKMCRREGFLLNWCPIYWDWLQITDAIYADVECMAIISSWEKVCKGEDNGVLGLLYCAYFKALFFKRYNHFIYSQNAIKLTFYHMVERCISTSEMLKYEESTYWN
jgi:hypothetical protein